MTYCPNTTPRRLSYMNKAGLERVYGLKVYTAWKGVPDYLRTKSQIRGTGIDMTGRIPVAIKSSFGTKRAYYLYDCRLAPYRRNVPAGRVYWKIW